MKLSNVLPSRGVLRSFAGRIACTILGLAIALAASSVSAATVYDVEDDFSSSNPSGGWTYGTYAALAGPTPDTTGFNAFGTYAMDSLGTPIDFWNEGTTDPNVSHNDTGAIYSAFGVTWGVNQVNVSPTSTTFAGIRFTAPETRLYALTSDFTNVQNNAAKQVYVYKNNVQVDTFSLGGSPHSYNVPVLPLTNGDVVDFVVAGSHNVALDATFAPVWSLAHEFSTTFNGGPNNDWAYGTTGATIVNGPPDTSTFTAFSHFQTTNLGGLLSNTIDFWDNGPDGDVDPGISHNPHNGQVDCCGSLVWEPNQVNFSPAEAAYVDATWTAPSGGLYTIDANFFNTQSEISADVYVYLNGTQLFAGTTGITRYDSTEGATYDSPWISLTEGDVLHFLANGGSHIAVSAIITPVPEPAACTLAILGVVGLVGARRRARLGN